MAKFTEREQKMLKVLENIADNGRFFRIGIRRRPWFLTYREKEIRQDISTVLKMASDNAWSTLQTLAYDCEEILERASER